MLPNSLNLNKTANNRAGIFHALGLSKADLSLSAWKSSNKTKFSLLKVLWGRMQKASVASLRLNSCPRCTHRNANQYLSPAAGWRLPEKLALGWRVFLTLEMATEGLPLFVSASGFHPAGLSFEAKRCFSLQALPREAGSWEAAGVQLSWGDSRGCWQPGAFPTFYLGWNLCACGLPGRGRQLCLRSGLPVSQSPFHTLCLHGLGK